jgi:sulfur carrier protein
MKIRVNGKEYQFDTSLNVSQLLQKLNIKGQWIVVELNTNIVDKQKYDETTLSDGDTVEIVGFVGGG